LKKDDSVGYRALVQTQDHLLLFLQQLGECASSILVQSACPVWLFKGTMDRLPGRAQMECTLNIFHRAICLLLFKNSIAF
jgi:hypothetical protein